ncbi:MAG: hypothetical protein H0V44_01395 [Planctomycetes bacterium]|nr:hypothetical protein [Planctomycetota bacterium]
MRSLLLIALATAVVGQDIGPEAAGCYRTGCDPNLIGAVAGMAGDQRATALFKQRGLDILSVTWEDTGRSKNSCWGPNISDLTIQVLGGPDRGGGWCMPVVRYPNFSDKTCDVPIERFKVLVGNHAGSALRAIDLGSYLRDFASYQTRPTGRIRGSLIAERDRSVLASAQACFLPIARGGEATFAPVLFNYQSRPGSPAVLAIMVTPEGTSAQVITNSSAASAGVWHGQRLFHNRSGERAPLRATRLSDTALAQPAVDGKPAATASAPSADGLSMVLVIQIPLVVPEPVYRAVESTMACDAAAPAAACKEAGSESAVVQSGPVEGPWIGLDGCTIERDLRFPIRATVQFYQATDRADLASDDVARVAGAIERIYLKADTVGSLVVDGATGRPTEHTAPAITWPQPWWQGVCEGYASTSGEPWQTAIARVRSRLGESWQPADARELRNALALARP